MTFKRYDGGADIYGNSLPEYNQTGRPNGYIPDDDVKKYGSPIYWVKQPYSTPTPYGEPEVEYIWSRPFLDEFQNENRRTANAVMKDSTIPSWKDYANVPQEYGSFGRYNTRRGNTIPYEEWQRQNNALGDEYGSVGRYNNINSPRGNGANDPNYQSLLEILDNAFGGEEY